MEIKDVENLAEMMKIELSDEEKSKILNDMDGILNYVKQIKEVNLPEEKENFEIGYQNKNIFRNDEIKSFENLGSITLQFPASQDGFLKVKKVL